MSVHVHIWGRPNRPLYNAQSWDYLPLPPAVFFVTMKNLFIAVFALSCAAYVRYSRMPSPFTSVYQGTNILHLARVVGDKLLTLMWHDSHALVGLRISWLHRLNKLNEWLLVDSGEAWCRCAMFVSSNNSEFMAMELPQVNITDCESHNQCKNRCTNEVSGYIWVNSLADPTYTYQISCQNGFPSC